MVVYYYRKVRLVEMNFHNKKDFERVWMWLCIILCLFPTGCRDKSEEYYNRGLWHLDKEQYDLAISEFNSAIRINPKLYS